MQFFTDLGSRYLDYAADVFLVLFDPTQRIFWLYLLTSAIFAYFVYRHGARKMQRDGHGEDAPKSFIGYLFPKQVWGHPSAWLDVRYFFFHKLIGHFLIFGLLMMMMGQSFSWITGESLLEFINRTAHVTSPWWVSVVYMLVVITVIDFVGFYIHYLQHKIPILWEFHKVHHSAEVMHPMSNFREHPIDNLAYQAFTGLGYGIEGGDGKYSWAPAADAVAVGCAGADVRFQHIRLQFASLAYLAEMARSVVQGLSVARASPCPPFDAS